MRSWQRMFYQSALVVIGAVLTALTAGATTNTFSFGANLGTLTYTSTSYSKTCNSAFGPVDYMHVIYSNFTY